MRFAHNFNGTMTSATYFSPAKLNLFFRVLSRRADGFHEIASLYQAVSLCDKLTIKRASQDQLTCNDPQVPCDETNLISLALQKYREKTGVSFPVSIHLEKIIPMQAGLGGGSGNAATTLWALNQLNPNPVSESDLQLWAGEFSSDAPFFFSKGTAYCCGKGEKLELLSPLPATKLWIAKPDEGLSTPLVFRETKVSELVERDPRLALKKILSGESSYFNDLEPAAFRLLSKLEDVKKGLISLGFNTVVMTGSGTAFFCLGEVAVPNMSGVSFYPVSFLQREEGNWYHYVNK